MTAIIYPLVVVAVAIFGFFNLKNSWQNQQFNDARIPDAIKQKSILFKKAAQEFGIPLAILKAMAWVESTGKQNAKGSAGERGVMQLKEIATKEVRRVLGVDTTGYIIDAETNIRIGAAYLKVLYQNSGVWDMAIKQYNQGPTGAKENPQKAAAYLEKVNKKKRFFS